MSPTSTPTDSAPDGTHGSTSQLAADAPLLRAVLWMPRGSRISGGHQVQLEETAGALGAFGVEARIESVESDDLIDLQGIDVVHGFNVTAAEIHHCRSLGLPVVVSTIYWDVRYGPDGVLADPSLRSVLGSFRLAGRFLTASLRNGTRVTEACLDQIPRERMMLAAFEAADLLLPNSEGEAMSIRRDLGVATPMAVVPNGVDPERFEQPGLPFEERDTVLAVGRMDPHKNQLGLIRALQGTGKKLVIAGYEHPDHAAYIRQCRDEGAGWVEFLAAPPQERLKELFAAARVHALPSWFETTGLVSLEAALSGCSIVTTDRGHAREYLGDSAFYCDPADTESIRRAVESAWQRPPDGTIRKRVLDQYTWAHVAEATAAAYRKVVAQRRGAGGPA